MLGGSLAWVVRGVLVPRTLVRCRARELARETELGRNEFIRYKGTSQGVMRDRMPARQISVSFGFLSTKDLHESSVSLDFLEFFGLATIIGIHIQPPLARCTRG